MVTRDRNDQRATGQDAVLKFKPNDGSEKVEVAITNVSWTRDQETTEIQDNQGLSAVIATTGVRFSGSFEYDGRQYDVLTKTFDGDDPVRATISVREVDDDGDSVEAYVYTFKHAMVTSQSRDYPADDVASASFDFVAEEMSTKEVSA